MRVLVESHCSKSSHFPSPLDPGDFAGVRKGEEMLQISALKPLRTRHCLGPFTLLTLRAILAGNKNFCEFQVNSLPQISQLLAEVSDS